MTETEFVEIMRILAKRIFLALFSFAQVSARVIPKPDDNKHESIRGDNPAVRSLLSKSQQAVLDQFHLESEDLEYAQSRFYKKGNEILDAIVSSIPQMFQQFASGTFPVLPDEVFSTTTSHTQSSEPVIDILSDILSAKAQPGSADNLKEDTIITNHGYSCTILFYNEVAKRMQTDSDFRDQLIQILMMNQSIVRTKLEK